MTEETKVEAVGDGQATGAPDPAEGWQMHKGLGHMRYTLGYQTRDEGGKIKGYAISLKVYQNTGEMEVDGPWRTSLKHRVMREAVPFSAGLYGLDRLRSFIDWFLRKGDELHRKRAERQGKDLVPMPEEVPNVEG